MKIRLLFIALSLVISFSLSGQVLDTAAVIGSDPNNMGGDSRQVAYGLFNEGLKRLNTISQADSGLVVDDIEYSDTYWDDLRVPLTNTRINPANSEPDFEDRGDAVLLLFC